MFTNVCATSCVKRYAQIGCALLLMAATSAARATLSTLQPPLNDLDTNFYYTWGVNATVPIGEQIKSVTLTFANLDDWIHPDPGNHLYVHLLDSVTPPNQTATSWVKRGVDYANPSDAFAGQGVLLTDYTDLGSGTITLNIEIPAAYLPWVADGNFGIGFDPDCYYYASGITLSMQSSSAALAVPLGSVAFTPQV